jgi:hypothetical protein
MTIETIGGQASGRGMIDGVGERRKVLIEVSIGWSSAQKRLRLS